PRGVSGGSFVVGRPARVGAPGLGVAQAAALCRAGPAGPVDRPGVPLPFYVEGVGEDGALGDGGVQTDVGQLCLDRFRQLGVLRGVLVDQFEFVAFRYAGVGEQLPRLVGVVLVVVRADL